MLINRARVQVHISKKMVDGEGGIWHKLGKHVARLEDMHLGDLL